MYAATRRAISPAGSVSPSRFAARSSTRERFIGAREATTPSIPPQAHSRMRAPRRVHSAVFDALDARVPVRSDAPRGGRGADRVGGGRLFETFARRRRL